MAPAHPQKEMKLKPTPNQAASDLIRHKPLADRQAFDALLPDLRARAFAVAGIEAADVLQSIRDTLADLPLGTDWATTKKTIAAQMHPYLDDSPDGHAASMRRAELLLRTHGFQAYQVANVTVLNLHRDVFPYWQYRAIGDSSTRSSHAALDGKIFPADDEFWRDHTPPWDFGCRCQIIPLAQDDIAEIAAEDEHLPPEARRIVEGDTLDELHTSGRLVSGPSQIADLRSPTARGEADPYTFDPSSLHLDLQQIAHRYDPTTFAVFTDIAKKTEVHHQVIYDEEGTILTQGTQTLWDWLSGKKLQDPIIQEIEGTRAALDDPKNFDPIPIKDFCRFAANNKKHPILDPLYTWGNDHEAFKTMMKGTFPEALKFKADITRLLKKIQPTPKETLWRGWNFESLQKREEVTAENILDGVFTQARIGMSTSASQAAATGHRYLNPHGELWEIRNTSSLVDFGRIFRAIGTKFSHEEEFVAPERTKFQIIEKKEITIPKIGKVPHIVLQEIL